MNNWIKETHQKPDFGYHVLCWCRIYGYYIRSYQQIDDTKFGNWNDGKDTGVLPPIYWMELPQLPAKEN